MYTHYMLTHIGDKVIAKVNGSVASTNVWYEADKELLVEKKDENVYAKPLDFIRYKLKREDVESSESVITINFPPDYNQTPTSSDLVFNINAGSSAYLSEKLELNNTFDRVIFTEIEEGRLMIGDYPIRQGTIYFSYQIKDIVYNHKVGVGSPYEVMKYKTSNGRQESEIRTISFNVSGGKALIERQQLDNGIEPEIIDDVKSIGIDFNVNLYKIKNLPRNKKVKLRFNSNLNNLERTYEHKEEGDDEAEVYGSTVYVSNKEFNTNGIHEFEFDTLDGEIELMVTIGKLYYQNTSVSGKLDFEILEVDGSTDNIDQENKKVSITVN